MQTYAAVDEGDVRDHRRRRCVVNPGARVDLDGAHVVLQGVVRVVHGVGLHSLPGAILVTWTISTVVSWCL